MQPNNAEECGGELEAAGGRRGEVGQAAARTGERIGIVANCELCPLSRCS